MQFSLDGEGRSHKRKQCSSSDSVGLIITRLYSSIVSDHHLDHDPVASGNQAVRTKPKFIYFPESTTTFTIYKLRI